jgi:hypothetical protein
LQAIERFDALLTKTFGFLEGTLTQESGDVRSVEGEVCGAVLVDE